MARASKGSAWERTICTELSLWWTNGKSDSVFWRSSTSGGRAKLRGRRGQKTNWQHGDIAAIDPIGNDLINVLTMELKRGYSRYTVMDLLDKPPKAGMQKYEEWIEQAEESHSMAGSFAWLIMFKRDKRTPFVLFPGYLGRTLSKMTDKFHEAIPSVCIEFSMPTRKSETFIIQGMKLDSFLSIVTPDMIKRVSKEY